jgi:hypothetical protein
VELTEASARIHEIEVDQQGLVNVRFDANHRLKLDSAPSPRRANRGPSVAQQNSALFDHTVGATEHRERDGKSEHFGSLEINE